jgi:hypothetical protein
MRTTCLVGARDYAEAKGRARPVRRRRNARRKRGAAIWTLVLSCFRAPPTARRCEPRRRGQRCAVLILQFFSCSAPSMVVLIVPLTLATVPLRQSIISLRAGLDGSTKQITSPLPERTKRTA